jgi:hypothetical protein
MNDLNYHLDFVVAQSDALIANRYLLKSPCLHTQQYTLHIHTQASSAAHAFNQHSQNNTIQTFNHWWIWVHQDVYLPLGWDQQFKLGLAKAQNMFDNLGVVGLYGVAQSGNQVTRIGHVIDRSEQLHEKAEMPALVDSLDELLIATRADLQLGFDPALGFDFYATDLVLEAKKRQITSAVIEAPCEHWSSSPKNPPFPNHLIERVEKSANYFESKWQAQLPITTPCFAINKIGDTSRFVRLPR